MVSAALLTSLSDTVRAGLSIFKVRWNYKARDWIMGVQSADIDHDGEVEVIASSRDGRVFVLNHEGGLLWERVIGEKEWVGAMTIISPQNRAGAPVRVIAGTRDGKVFALDQAGNTIGKSGKRYRYGKDGRALEPSQELQDCWLDTGAVIRHMFADPASSPDVIIGSQDGYAYAIDFTTRELHWRFHAHGWVRAVFCGDINGDGEIEFVIGTNEKMLYVVSSEGEQLDQIDVGYPIHALYAADVDNDRKLEILVGTDGKFLAAFTPDLQEKWHIPVDNRILALHAADINHDGQLEIIAGSEDKHLYILNGQGKTLWRHNLDYRAFSVHAKDINHDGQVEIVVGAEDAKVHVYDVQLVKDLDKRILSNYQKLGAEVTKVANFLSVDEWNLLQDLLGGEVKQHESLKHMTIERAEQLIEAKRYKEALSLLRQLERQHVQLLWRRERKELGFLRSLCFGRMKNGRRSLIIGTNEGDIKIFTLHGKMIGSVNIGQRVLEMQTGYVERGKPEAIIMCTSDHNVYVVSGTTDMQKHRIPLDYETACIYVSNGNRRRPSEILTGSGTNIHVYDEGFQVSPRIISMTDGIRLVHAHAKTEDGTVEIIAGSASRAVHAFTREGEFLWSYPAHDRVQCVEVRAIDSDGEVAVIAGSEDRNIHFIDRNGHLRWRYFLPHTVLACQAFDIDQDGKMEILAGCADGYLYVFSRDGDLLWKYRASDRIRAVKAIDFDEDGNTEIVLGVEDELEVLQIVNLYHVHNLIDRCVDGLQETTSLADVYTQLLDSGDPEVEAFAISHLAQHATSSSMVFDILDQHMKSGFDSVRVAILRSATARYADDPLRSGAFLDKLAQDTAYNVRHAFIEQMPELMRYDWQRGFDYLARFFAGSDRLIRRAVVRQIDHIIDKFPDREKDRQMFELLLKATWDKESTWIHQEAARALAHFLDSHQGRLIIYMHLFIASRLAPEIIEMIGNCATSSLVQKFVKAVLPFLGDVREDDIQSYIFEGVSVLSEMTSLKFGEDAWKMYGELARLYELNTVDDISLYHCSLTAGDFNQHNQLARIVLRVLEHISSITRCLALYKKRESTIDQLTALLDAIKTIDAVSTFVEQEYARPILGYPATYLPDHLFFKLLLKRWRSIVLAQLNELRGSAALTVELQTKNARYDEQVTVLFSVSNNGRGSADNVKVSLLASEDFDIVGHVSVETETLSSRDALPAEFTIRPHTDCPVLHLEVVFDDAEDTMQREVFTDRLELESIAPATEYLYIPNPYSTGTPIHDSQMFYGRGDDIASLCDKLTRAAAQTVLLLRGQRRTGKTSLLFHLLKTAVLEEHIPVLIDMQQAAFNTSDAKLLHNIALSIARTMNKKGYTIALPARDAYDRDGENAFRDFLDEVEANLREQKLIILMDEFEMLEEQIENQKLDPRILNYLRGIMQDHPRINFLLSGTSKLDQMTEKRENWSVFFTVAEQYRLSRLSPQGAEDLIGKPAGRRLEFAPHAVEKIRQFAADQPYLIHLICRALIDHCNERRKTYVALHDVNAAARTAMQTCTAHFDWLWKQLSNHERLTLAVLAEHGKEEGRWLNFGEIEGLYLQHHLPYDRERSLSSLKALIEADIVEKESGSAADSALPDGRYKVSAGLMRIWLLKEKPLRLMSSPTQPLTMDA